MRTRRQIISITLLCTLLVLTPLVLINGERIRAFLRQQPFILHAMHMKTVDDQIATYGTPTRKRLDPIFRTRGLSYPPRAIGLIAFKTTHRMQVYAQDQHHTWTFVTEYPIKCASGNLGPKLKEGDHQIPEGVYAVALEPNTPFHLALRLNYPNAFDLQHARAEGRNPGGDILIHGSNCSIGCLAMGDPTSEDLFVLAHDTGAKNVHVIIAPMDFRTNAMPAHEPGSPDWIQVLYKHIAVQLTAFPVPAVTPVSDPPAQ